MTSFDFHLTEIAKYFADSLLRAFPAIPPCPTIPPTGEIVVKMRHVMP